jgi:hypothetical protein
MLVLMTSKNMEYKHGLASKDMSHDVHIRWHRNLSTDLKVCEETYAYMDFMLPGWYHVLQNKASMLTKEKAVVSNELAEENSGCRACHASDTQAKQTVHST